ncbi:DUF6314 family protein [Seohaeicola saemankumensis]|uniref:DUF6314 family protein n=1 Tax=Seohaeicola saemankumensis TaxID=481181 RepID=A0ABW3TAN6_9RHOB
MLAGKRMIGLMDFEGRWRLDRQITDTRGADALFTGWAVFAADAEGLDLHEAGRLELKGQGGFQAERRYLWRQDGAGIAVLFADGRAFHRFDPAARTALADHWCDPDTYEVRYDFSGWPVWRAEWRVTGPRKDYVMTSVYTPAAGISPKE